MTVNFSNMTVSRGEQSIKLPAKVFEFLKLFITSENHTLVKEFAIETIWEGNEAVGKKAYVNAMWQIRKTFADLGVDSNEYFNTLPKVGYVLTLKPELVEQKSEENTRANSKPILLVLGVSIAALISLLLFFHFSDDDDTQKAVSSAQAKIEKNKAIYFAPITHFTNYQGVEEYPRISNDGKYMAFQWLRDNGEGNLYIKNIENPKAPIRKVTQSILLESSPAWSPDDNELAYVQRNEQGEHEVRIKNLITNQDRFIALGGHSTHAIQTLDWSPDRKKLIYVKLVDDHYAIFSFNLEAKKETQLTFPSDGADDIAAKWYKDSKGFVFVRSNVQKHALIQKNSDGSSDVLISEKASLTGFTWVDAYQALLVNLSKEGKIVTEKHSLIDGASTVVNSIQTASNLTFNPKNKLVYVSRHLSNEYIIQRSLYDQRAIKRVSSSSRDLYGRYVTTTAEILFVSNRGGMWDLWLQTMDGAKNLTQGIGNTFFAMTSFDGEMFTALVHFLEGKDDKLYLGSLKSGLMEAIDVGELTPRHPSWSQDSRTIYFSSTNDGITGVYKYNIDSRVVTQLTQTGELFTVEGKDGALYFSRKGQKGIWRYLESEGSFEQVVSELEIKDFASFFWEQDKIFFIQRTKLEDKIVSYQPATKVREEVLSFPANSIRKYSGISFADEESLIINMNSIYDADIYTFPLNSD